MAMIDITKTHVDVGLRVCDYPTIQDYVGEGAPVLGGAVRGGHAGHLKPALSNGPPAQF